MKPSIKSTVRDVISTGLNVYERKVNRELITDLVARFTAIDDPLVDSAARRDTSVTALRMLAFVKGRVDEELRWLLDLKRFYSEYAKRYSRATTTEDRERHIMTFAADLGANPRQLRGDRQALSRWFGHDAVCERYSRRCSMVERKLSFMLERLGYLVELVLGGFKTDDAVADEWGRIQLETTLKPFFAYEGDSRVTIAAFRALARALRALPSEMRERCVDENTLQFMYRAAMHPRLDVWLQCEALCLLEHLSVFSFERVLHGRLTRPAGGDDLFVRKRAVTLLARNVRQIPSLTELISYAAKDPSPFVRQGLADGLPDLPLEFGRRWLRRIALQDEDSAVRASALLAICVFVGRQELLEESLGLICHVFENEKDSFVLRVAIHVSVEIVKTLVRLESAALDRLGGTLYEGLDRLHVDAEKVPVRRWAAQARERIWCEMSSRSRRMHGFLVEMTEGWEPGKQRSFPRRLIRPGEDDHFGRVLSVVAQDEYGLEVTYRAPRLTMTRGHLFGFRLWRFLHEFARPSPDKRQSFRHTIGRLFGGDLRAPSNILSELAQTRVPGEPLFVGQEGGWRPYLPLVDEVVSSLSLWPRDRPVKIFTSEGVTELLPPPLVRDRLRAYWKLTRRFEYYGSLRNWQEGLSEKPGTYVAALEELGFRVTHRPHVEAGGRECSVDGAVARFFPAMSNVPVAAALPFSFSEVWRSIWEYFYAVDDNTLFELGLFTAVGCALFIARHIYSNRVVQRSRKRIPLVVGGWGTRGKSGTERIKAALFNALGYGLVSKTTGCEAMFLYCHPFGETREMFLFRSYDKATIWEQEHVMRLSAQLGADVFLWECMALTPSYVDVLQRHWVRDDIATITNTYPDHEDLQGPAGINLPDVMRLFIPQGKKVITSEDQMAPVLKNGARQVDAGYRHVDWLEFGLLTHDVVGRFPYEEHPNNIALVLAMAEELGVDRDFAVKEMADRVVADLGVLKTSPVAPVRGRRLQFTNGCSANERHGAMGNWTRLGFDTQDAIEEPGVWVTTVINNRADRVPRSKVFARLIVEDFASDRHFLIGGNVQGFVGYVKEAWDAYSRAVTIWPEEGDEEPRQVLERTAHRFRLPTEDAHVDAKLEAMLRGLGLGDELVAQAIQAGEEGDELTELFANAGHPDKIDAALKELRRCRAAVRRFAELQKKVGAASSRGEKDSLEGEFRHMLWTWSEEKLVVVEDYHASGDQVIDIIVNETPPGFLNRIIGLQNIKGTGLDFVYRWEAWCACHKACDQLRSSNESILQKGLKSLAAFREYGLLCEEFVRETLESVRSQPAAQSETVQAELALIVSNSEVAMQKVREKMSVVRAKASRLDRFVAAAEGFIDAGDAVKRKRRANQIYADLVTERISIQRAALELKAINKRQKGGWLQQKIGAIKKAVGKNLGGFFLRNLK